MAKFRVVITECDFEMPPVIEAAELAPVGAEVIVEQCKSEDELIAACANADALLFQYAPLTARVLDSLERCKVIVRYGTGMDTIDIPAAVERGIICCNVTGFYIGEVADHTMALLLVGNRAIVKLNDSVRRGEWDAVGVSGSTQRNDGLTLGFIGLGAIATAVAARARPFGLNLIAYSPRAPESAFAAAGITRVGLDDLLEQSDYVSVHTPLRAATRHLIGARELALMKPTAYLINTARGGLIDSDALCAALESGDIAGAALDVFDPEPMPADSPLRQAPNLIVTPHSGFYSQTSIEALRRETAAEAARVLNGGEPTSQVTVQI
ncbi:MAG: C-terminal binding protein [Chloroflexota bacterium]|jgi:D-3-phosphoglycerate dehydrogenase|nr:C-terminal binding protein [Chloroflexota bacterium]